MKHQFPSDFPLGYDDKTVITLTANNEIVLHHPVMPPMIYDETVMRYVEVSVESSDAGKTD